MKKEKTFTPSLQEVNATVDTRSANSRFRKLFAFFGPAYLVSVGYMDPGNWATDLAGGSQFGYSLLWVLLMSNLIALLLQSLSARLGIVRGLDLAQASREMYPRPVNISLYILAEIAIAACDLAEVLGMAIGLQLLFGLDLLTGVLITVLDTFVLLFLLNLGIRKLEAFIISLVLIIGLAFFIEIVLAKPQPLEIATGFIPSIPTNEALLIAIGIIGATVMPHNLYLHSSLVQTRRIERDTKSIRKAIRFNIADSAIALNMAFFVNASILILAATVFFKNGIHEVAEIQDAHKLLAPMLGTQWASVLFAVALIASGQSSTITGTLAGQIVMEGYLNLRIHPWMRRLLTRAIAIIPALLTIQISGEAGTGRLLILSQVILSLQLGFAIVPLIHFVSDKEKMRDFVIKPYIKALAWLCAAVIVSLNVKLVVEQVNQFLTAGSSPVIQIFVLLICALATILMLVTVFYPWVSKRKAEEKHIPHATLSEIILDTSKKYSRVALALDFSSSDLKTIQHAAAQGGKDARYMLIHVVETAGALAFGTEIEDYETHKDIEMLHSYADRLRQLGYNTEVKIGFGSPKKSIPQLVKSFNSDLLVMGAHGHSTLKDLVFGTTVEAVRHAVKIPVLIV